MNAEARTLVDYAEVVRRRKMWFAVPLVVITTLAGLFAYSLPSVYYSAGRILIEDQDIPANMVGVSSEGFATQQIELIEERVLTDDNVRRIVAKHGVYEARGNSPSSQAQLVGEFRSNVSLQLSSAPIIDPRSRARQAAIAFNLGFLHSDPETAFKVADELVNGFLSLNRDRRLARTARVSSFLEEAVAEAEAELRAKERRFARFKTENEGALPEQYSSNVLDLGRSESELVQTMGRIQELENRKRQLSTQLTTMSPTAPVILSSGERVLNDQQRLRALMSEYRKKSAVYKPGHPDLLRLEREISVLRQSGAGTSSFWELSAELKQEQEGLAQLEARYGPEHPDVLRARSMVSSLEEKLAAMGLDDAPGEGGYADNPAYILLQGQIRDVEAEVSSLQRREQELRGRIERYKVLINRGPTVEIEHDAIAREVATAAVNLAQLEESLNSAEVVADVEGQLSTMGFTLIEPPAIPLEPVAPNRMAILLFGFLLSIGIGAFAVATMESLDNTVRGERAVKKVFGVPPLVTVPYLGAGMSQRRSVARRIFLLMLVVGTILVVLGYVLLL